MTTNVDREQTHSHELRDEELEQVVGGSITRKIDASSPKLFETCCSETPLQAPSL
jgi:type VI protein secretion system component Hcp